MIKRLHNEYSETLTISHPKLQPSCPYTTPLSGGDPFWQTGHETAQTPHLPASQGKLTRRSVREDGRTQPHLRATMAAMIKPPPFSVLTRKKEDIRDGERVMAFWRQQATTPPPSFFLGPPRPANYDTPPPINPNSQRHCGPCLSTNPRLVTVGGSRLRSRVRRRLLKDNRSRQSLYVTARHGLASLPFP